MNIRYALTILPLAVTGPGNAQGLFATKGTLVNEPLRFARS